MWTARNISDVLDNVQTEVNRLVTAASCQQKSTDTKSAGLLEFGDDRMQRFCQLEENGNHIDSPCFRLGSGGLKLHHHHSDNCGVKHSTVKEKPAIRSVKRGKFITCYATCCNRGLSEGCRVCDRLPHESSSSGHPSTMQLQENGEREIHFVNVKERPPIEISNADEMAKILCMTRAGVYLYNKFKERASSMPTSLALDIQDAFTKGDVPAKMQALQNQLDNLNKFTKIKREHKDEMRRVECDSHELVESRLDAFELIQNVETAVHNADTQQGTDIELFDAIEKLERHPDIPATYTSSTNRGTIKIGLKELKKANFVSMVALTRKRQRDMDDVTANFAYDMNNMIEDVTGVVDNGDDTRVFETTVSDNCRKTDKIQRVIEELIRKQFNAMCTSLGVRGLGKRLRIDSSSESNAFLELHSYDLQ